jgi:hypothetical protein
MLPPSRYIDLRSGSLMAVTDLHGDGDAFDRYLRTFFALYENGEVDRLLLMGDLIHGYGPAEEDHSLRMILRVMELQAKLGPDRLMMLIGNHEMPHIYGVSLAKGEQEFTPRFEHSLGKHRYEVVEFLKTLPFAVRTGAGVLFTHAGPDADSINRITRLRDFRHDDLIEEAESTLRAQGDLTPVYEAYEQISGHRYEELAREYLAVSGPGDGRYSQLLRALYIQERDHRFAVLWDFLFTQNERDMPIGAYEQVVLRYLDAFSIGAPSPQRVCVSGHIKVKREGYQIVTDQHLRLASAAHASPREAGKYMLLEMNKPIHKAEDLLPKLYSIF